MKSVKRIISLIFLVAACSLVTAWAAPAHYDVILRGGMIVALGDIGEGDSMGPLNDAMKAGMVRLQSDIHYDIEWTTLAE